MPPLHYLLTLLLLQGEEKSKDAYVINLTSSSGDLSSEEDQDPCHLKANAVGK